MGSVEDNKSIGQLEEELNEINFEIAKLEEELLEKQAEKEQLRREVEELELEEDTQNFYENVQAPSHFFPSFSLSRVVSLFSRSSFPIIIT